MSISIIKKAAALFCSAAAALSMSAVLSASAAGSATFEAQEVYADPGETVHYEVYLKDNPGYAALGLPLVFDERLTVVGANGTDISTSSYALGEASNPNGILNYNGSKHIIAYSSSSSGSNKNESGLLYKVDIKVPDDAQPGDTFEMKLMNSDGEAKPKQFVDENSAALGYVMDHGWIKIKEITTTTTESETTVTTTTTTVSEDPGTTSTTESGDTDTNTETTTTVSGSEGGATDSTSNGNGGSDVPGPKTGETGAALAIAGLLTAAGAAYAIRRKH
ncbi:MAG: LPXTG cell wall anchor domain-containing protein [Oscillospiraceae bacterium]|nr:LPXTG cell wall anchor domain-containing protein [Oscillospiraceae bacterium]